MPKIKPFTTFAIGSFPYDDPKTALDLMGETLDIPAAPQMVRLSPWEDMLLGAVDGIPFVSADEHSRVITAPLDGREEKLALFYENYYSGDFSSLERGEKSSLGYSAFLNRAKDDPSFGSEFLKTQVVGPLTFGQSVKVEGAFGMVDDPGLLDAASSALGAKVAWEAEAIRKLGRTPVVFFDEPGLSGYGSAFSTLSAERVLSALSLSIQAAKEKGETLVGVHVCGNMDWGLLTKSGVDILNFDAFGYQESVALYPKELSSFLENGGYLAWGIVPTSAYDKNINPQKLRDHMLDGFRNLSKHKIPMELLREQALITSSCGLGSLVPEIATAVLRLLPELKKLLLDSKL
jgi:methionine synthase II (cobalamin-independent)